MRPPKQYSIVLLTLTIATSCGDRKEAAKPSEAASPPTEISLPESTPLPDWLTVEEIGWHGDENNYAYKTVSDAEALASIQEVFGVQIEAAEAKIVHSVSETVHDVHEYGMRLNPRRAKTILDELHDSFLKTKALPGTRFEGWVAKGRGDRESHKSPLIYDGLEFGIFDYLTFSHPDYMSSDSSKKTMNRIYAIFAVVDLEDGDFYVTLSDWGDD